MASNLVKLSQKVRFRREADYILLCDLRTLREFSVPLEYADCLDMLQRGFVNVESLGKTNELLIADLEALGLLSENAVSPRIWESLEFE